MAKLSYPTVNLLENCLKMVYPNGNICLSGSLNILGDILEQFDKNTPQKVGTIPIKVNTLTGIDIPVLVENGYTNKGTITIVAQDPLRSDKDDMLKGMTFNEPIIGTPFALHYKKDAYPQTEVYRIIIQGLLKEGFKVYVTDIWKCWDEKKATRYGRWGNSNPHFVCLAEEIKMIKPVYVILMGNHAHDKFKSKEFQDLLCPKINLISVPHPSASANGAWVKKFEKKYGPGKKVDSQSKAKYIIEEVLPRVK